MFTKVLDSTLPVLPLIRGVSIRATLIGTMGVCGKKGTARHKLHVPAESGNPGNSALVVSQFLSATDILPDSLAGPDRGKVSPFLVKDGW